ncbi:flagellar protein FliT [Aestuariirhabdus sp. LZHN29]|uniref:flagellar protein FliT n=1 Tax=Aestuariirhabdus sp. LZHN29 TaxID=3417462 RepID=UPI003CF2EC1C
MPASTTATQLEDLCQQIRGALSQENWEALSGLDDQCRKALVAVGDEQVLKARLQDEPELAQALLELQQSYGALVDRCRQHRDNLREELTKARRGGQAARAYTQR